MSFALDLCSCKRGFFTLRDCANSAVTSCSACSRRICAEHITQAGLCVECVAKRSEDAALDETSTTYAIRSRQRWYGSSNYSPVWWGTSDPYWNDTDYRWYEGNDDDDGGGFGDS
ncbi:hypothetical protein OJ997_22770 [Solirubrobacter phytolaccae]|uniref:Uncharacterized protein n=1 Tax=Solirubrobacter phytolaccae TaxID=1404360 RepID=A0A9X3NBZ2_9ACTN|nr:hypothetical protein [Solirubrobacter phytolaccae]MDA0183151.1 hypothetical protein [Solirubrobacter phytolaccae]